MALMLGALTGDGLHAQVCGTTVYDPGGPAGDYPNSANWTVTYCPDDPGDAVSLIFTMFQLENNWDNLYIYNGPTTGSPLIGTYTGGTSPGTVTSTDPSGCLTLRFTSDGSVTYAGWAAEVICGDLPPPPPVCG
ncbi:MAG: CUB domain-containing protein, partial [Flavobacteriales bacterium]|nr:CUB domain-containing protein [Flavobacteriales bacterium]